MSGELSDNVIRLRADDDGVYRVNEAADAVRVTVTSNLATYGDTTTLAVMDCTLPGAESSTTLVYHPGNGDAEDAKVTASISSLWMVDGLVKAREARKGNFYYNFAVDHRSPGKGYGGMVKAGIAAVALAASLRKVWKARQFPEAGYYTTEKKPKLIIRGSIDLHDLRPYHDLY